jgi:hypothetical protein
MSAKVIKFPSSGAISTPIGHFLRLGDSGVRALGDLIAGGHLLPARVVVDAGNFSAQRDLIQDLRLRGVEIVLDTKVAELGSKALSGSKLKSLPWAVQTEGSPLGPDHFGRGANTDVIDAIARFCVVNRVDAVLSPSHWLGDPDCDDWLSRDGHSCHVLRDSLDREGGKDIAIDFSVVAPHTLIREPSEREKLFSVIRDCEVENVWIRASGMKNGAPALSTSRHIQAIASYQGLELPLIADCLGGMTGLGLIAFGSVSGIAHGIGRYIGFDARSWHKAPRLRASDDDNGRAQKRILLSDINRSLSAREVECLASARNGRKLISCTDRECCPSGLDDMLRDPRRHSARQTIKQYHALESVPDLKRPEHFIHNQLEDAARKARRIAKLRPEIKDGSLPAAKIQSLVRRMEENADTLDKTRTALEKLQNDLGAGVFSPKPLRSRQAQKALFDMQGKF